MTTLQSVPYHSDAASPTRRSLGGASPPIPADAPPNQTVKTSMQHKTKTLLATLLLSVCTVAVASTGAAPEQDGIPRDRYNHTQHNGQRDVYTEGAHGIRERDVYTDGAYGTRKPDPYTDGARLARPADLAGMDLRGVSAQPA